MNVKTIVLAGTAVLAVAAQAAAKAPADPAKALAAKARSYLNAQRINLRDYDAAKAAFEEALKAETNLDAHASLAFDYGRYLYVCGQEPAETCEKRKLDAYRTPGLKAVTRLGMLKSGVPGLSYAADGLKVAEEAKDERLVLDWYREATRPASYADRDKDPLDPVNCDDYKTAKCDEAIAKLAPKYHEEFKLSKAQFYRLASRWDDAERIYRAELDALTNKADRARARWYGHLADLCVDRSARYYAKPDAGWTAKAIGNWNEVLKLEPKNVGVRHKIVERSMLIGDWALAEKTLDEMTPLMKDAKPDAWMTAVYGDIAYYRGDYEKAVKWYATYPKFPDGPAVVRIPNSHQRHAGALYATGRYEECLKAIDSCPSFWSFKDVNAVYRKRLKEKIEASKGVKESAR